MTIHISLITALLGIALTGSAIAAEANEETTPDQRLAALWPELTAEEPGARRGAEQQWQEFCFLLSAPGRDAQRAEANRAMTRRLDAAPVPARVWLLTQLERIGGADCVPAVAAQLDHPDPLVRDAARRALSNNPSAEAGARLRERLEKTGDADQKAALINALGYRAEEDSTAVLGAHLSSSDAQVVAAAARALGHIATPAAAGALGSARKTAPRAARLTIGDAYLRCADRMLAAGQTADAAAIYRDLNTPGEPARLAALNGVLRTSGDAAGTIILDVLAGDDVAAQRVAIHHVNETGLGSLRLLAAGWSKLPVEGQILLLGALGTRGEPAGLPIVLEAAGSDSDAVRLAALRALGGVGDASALPLLIDAVQAGGDEASAARGALESISASGVDQRLTDAVKQTGDSGLRIQLIDVLARRRAVIAVPTLLEEILHDNGQIRRRAMAALGQLAGAEDVAGMIRGLLHSDEGSEREDAERAITQVCTRIPDEAAQAEPVAAVYRRSDPAGQQVILPVLGRIGGPTALQMIRHALQSPAAEREAGIRALCNWPDTTVAEDLLELARSETQETHRVRTLRALARVAVLPGQRSEENKLQLLKDGIQLATRNQERDLILDRAREARTVEAARFAADYLDDPELAQRACRTIVDLAHRREIRAPHQQEFDELLQRVIQVSTDRGMADRARSYLSDP